MSLTDLPTPTALLPQQQFEHPLMEISRNSKKWVFDSRGLLTEYAPDQVAYDHDPVTGVYKGRLYEESRTNLCTKPDLRNWSNQSGITVTKVTDSKFENYTVNKIEFDGTDNSVYEYFDASSKYFSIYVKYVNHAEITIRQTSAGGGDFNIQEGNIISDGSKYETITNVGDGWYRIGYKDNGNGTGTVRVQLTNPSAGASVLVALPQVEQGSFPTSYIPTSGSTVTREADIPVFNNLSWYNQNEGTFVVEVTTIAISTNITYPFTLNDGTIDNFYGFRKKTDGDWYISGRTAIDGAFSETSFGLQSANDKLAMTYDTAFHYTLNGGTVETDNNISTELPISELRFSGLASTSGSVTIKSLLYYPKALTDAQLKALTR